MSNQALRFVMRYLQEAAESLAQAEGERRLTNRYSAAARQILTGFIDRTGLNGGGYNFGGGPAGVGLAVPVTLHTLGIDLEALRVAAQGAVQGAAASGATAVTEAQLAAAVAGATEVVSEVVAGGGGGGEIVAEVITEVAGGGGVSEIGAEVVTDLVAGGGGGGEIVAEAGRRGGSAVAVTALAEADGSNATRVRQAVVVFMVVAGICIGFSLGYYLGTKANKNPRRNSKDDNGHDGSGGNGSGGDGNGGGKNDGGGNGEVPAAK